ncbi:MAG: NAD(P)/FAD-dependent oxidoreductase [Gammaproteobacteria bacterium]
MMNALKRRDFLTRVGGGAAALLAATSWPASALAQGRSRVVIVGGGFGGATCAKYLRRADPTIAVTLIEREPHYVTGPMSNAVIGGLRSLDDITVSYDELIDRYGVNLIQGNVVAIDAVAKSVTLDRGDTLAYDRLVVAPGIDSVYTAIDGYGTEVTERMPHAWQPGPQTLLLRRQIEAMDDGGVVIITIPQMPYRCPPGPYERASLIANDLKRHKPKSKILILDANDGFPKQKLFMQGWEALYPGMIEWVPGNKGGRVTGVEPETMIVFSEFERYRGDVVNVIPPERAGAIATVAGLTDAGGWCPVDPRTFESSLQPSIHVIGDAARAGKLPKSGAAANAEGKVCAMALAALLNDQPVGDPAFINACYSLLAPDYGISIAAVFGLTTQGIMPLPDASGTSPVEASQKYRRKEAEDAQGWYDSIVADTFA